MKRHPLERIVSAVGGEAMKNDELMHLRRRLKSGEYSGVDIMSAWLALDELVAARKDAERHRKLRRMCCSAYGPTEAIAAAWFAGDEEAADAALDAVTRE